MDIMKWIASLLLVCMVLGAQQGSALVSEARPGIVYRDQVMFLDKKLVTAGSVAWVTLAYNDPRASRDCSNVIDVFNGRSLFAQIPEKSWVLVDFALRSLVIQAGFAGDADVSKVVLCADERSCRDMQGKSRESMQKEQPQVVPPADLEEASQRMSLGRQLIKAARCRGCHVVEGFGAKHAPSLTWRRAKYQPGWLMAYLSKPYRLRPAMTSLMMLRYTSPLAQPSLQPEELVLVADFLQRSAWFSPPAGRFRLEPWETYSCQPCHARLYAERPLRFSPTPVPTVVRAELKKYGAAQSCLACHAFGDMQTAASWSGPPYPYPMAPDLLLALEKLRLDYFVDYLRDPAYLQPGSAMPRLDFTEAQVQQIKAWGGEVQRLIREDVLQPLHRYYQMQKRP